MMLAHQNRAHVVFDSDSTNSTDTNIYKKHKGPRNFWNQVMKPKLREDPRSTFLLTLFANHKLEFSWDYMSSLPKIFEETQTPLGYLKNFHQAILDVLTTVQEDEYEAFKIKLRRLCQNPNPQSKTKRNYNAYKERFLTSYHKYIEKKDPFPCKKKICLNSLDQVDIEKNVMNAKLLFLQHELLKKEEQITNIKNCSVNLIKACFVSELNL